MLEFGFHAVVRMRSFGLQPDAQSYTAAIGACGVAGHWEEALKLLHRAETEITPERSFSLKKSWKNSPFRGILANCDGFTILVVYIFTSLFIMNFNIVSLLLFFWGGWKKYHQKICSLFTHGHFLVAVFCGCEWQDNLCWAAALSALDHCGRWQEALDLLLRMLGSVFEPLKKWKLETGWWQLKYF